jgi:hypothetical protein
MRTEFEGAAGDELADSVDSSASKARLWRRLGEAGRRDKGTAREGGQLL